MTYDVDLLFSCKTHTPEMLFEFVKSIKNREMRSNSQWTIQSMKEKYDKEQIWINIVNDIAIVLFKDRESIIRLSYYSRNQQALSLLNSIIPDVKDPVVCDLLGKEPKISEYASELIQVGLKPYAQYRRMLCTQLIADDSVDVSEVENAKVEDEDELFDMLHEEFDVLTARMPSKDIIRQRIIYEDVFIIRKNKKIAGFIIFESRNKKNALLEYVMVRPEFRNLHIATKIWNYKLSCANESKYYYLWVNTDRKTAIKFHENNGYHFDGLVDNIFIITQ